jgi:SEC-C motif-containing protein
LHLGRAATNALALMRSRYSAYALGKVTYIIDTTCKGQPAFEDNLSAWRAQIETFCRETKFTSLQIHDFSEQQDAAWVSFTAGLKQANQTVSLAERSHFLRRKRKWFYASGAPLGANTTAPI